MMISPHIAKNLLIRYLHKTQSNTLLSNVLWTKNPKVMDNISMTLFIFNDKIYYFI
jgi:hypothetical protein